MVDGVDADVYCGNNDGVITTGNLRPMSPQERYPHITTSISGIAVDEWKALSEKARREGITNKEALERAIRSVVADMKDGKDIAWRPSKVAPRKPIKIHDDILEEVKIIGNQLDLRINVIVSTAIYRWLNNSL